jgi:hypothetical protein
LIAVDEAVDRWARSGMMSLTGRQEPNLGAPIKLIQGLDQAAESIRTQSARLGRQVRVDPLRLMAERAAISGLRRGGFESCGRSTHLMQCEDGWIALAMARSSDWDLAAALVHDRSPIEAGDWARLSANIRNVSSSELRSRAELLSLPLSKVGECNTRTSQQSHVPIAPIRKRIRDARPVDDLEGAVVVDLSALWAGPLAGSLLRAAGADVVKVESHSRPDGARFGASAFYELLNAGKASVAFDFSDDHDRHLLRELISSADVVITSARRRALDQLGLFPEKLMSDQGPKIWLNVTGYSSVPHSLDRVAFGDDAGAAGGLVTWDREGPCFCGDAIADPLTGIIAASWLLEAIALEGAWEIEAPMADIAANYSGPFVGAGAPVALPPVRSQRSEGCVAELGADTLRIMRQLEIS